MVVSVCGETPILLKISPRSGYWYDVFNLQCLYLNHLDRCNLLAYINITVLIDNVYEIQTPKQVIPDFGVCNIGSW